MMISDDNADPEKLGKHSVSAQFWMSQNNKTIKEEPEQYSCCSQQHNQEEDPTATGHGPPEKAGHMPTQPKEQAKTVTEEQTKSA